VCTSPSFERELSRGWDNLDVNRCKSCGFVYLASWEQSLAKSQELYDYYGQLSEQDMTRRHSPENRARQQELLKALSGYTRGRRLLDVGCGDGQLLQTAKDEGWNALGIDLSDAIVMSELIEHVPSPQRFFKRAEELLDVGGVLYLTTPNFGSLARRMLGETWSVIHSEHIGYFERSTLSRLASEETGLREIRIEANNIAPSTFVTWLRRRGNQTGAKAANVHRGARRGLDQRLRRAVHQSPALGASRDLLNHAISRAGLGDTLVAWLQKPPD
jgi:SAM-dependent methyltransferase